MMPQFLLMLLLSTNTALPEDLPTMGLGDLVYFSPVIFRAKPLGGPVETISTHAEHYEYCRFLVQEVIRKDSLALPDTVKVVIQDYCIKCNDFKEYLFYGYNSPPYQERKGTIFIPFLSGIRPFAGDTAYVPFQHENPGCYQLHPKPGERIVDWVSHTYRTIERFDSLLSLRRIQPPADQNKALFDWINKHKYCWTIDPNLVNSSFSDCDWGQYPDDVFKWINGNGIWQDAWKSMLLSRAYMPQYIQMSRPEDTPNAFACEEARAFLMGQIASGDEADIALRLLSDDFYDCGRYTSLPETDQQKIIRLALPYLERRETMYTVYYLIQAAMECAHSKALIKRNTVLLEALKKAHAACLDEYFKKKFGQLILEIEGP